MPEALVPNFDQLLGEYRAKSADQNAALKQYLDNMFSAQEKNANRASQVDLSPAMAWFDSQFGSNLQRGYSKPQGADEIQAQSDQYNNAVNQARLGIPKADMESLKTQLDYMFRKDQMDQNAELKKDTLAAKVAQGDNKPSEGLKTLDREFAKDYHEYVNKAGEATALTNIQTVKDAARQLTNNPNLTGPGKGKLPWKAVLTPDTQSLIDKLEGAVEASLRPILGSQFTEGEGKRILQRTINADLPAEENLYRINNLLKKLEAAKVSKDDAVKYFENNRQSLGGYKKLNLKDSFYSEDYSTGLSKSDTQKKKTREEMIAELKAREGK